MRTQIRETVREHLEKELKAAAIPKGERLRFCPSSLSIALPTMRKRMGNSSLVHRRL